MNKKSLDQSKSSCEWCSGSQRNILLSRNIYIRECTVTSCDTYSRGQSPISYQWNLSYKGPLCIFFPIQASDDESAVDIVYCNDFQLVESGTWNSAFLAAIFATTFHILVHF